MSSRTWCFRVCALTIWHPDSGDELYHVQRLKSNEPKPADRVSKLSLRPHGRFVNVRAMLPRLAALFVLLVSLGMFGPSFAATPDQIDKTVSKAKEYLYT